MSKEEEKNVQVDSIHSKSEFLNNEEFKKVVSKSLNGFINNKKYDDFKALYDEYIKNCNEFTVGKYILIERKNSEMRIHSKDTYNEALSSKTYEPPCMMFMCQMGNESKISPFVIPRRAKRCTSLNI